MKTVLVVIRPFAGWMVGDVIDNAREMRSLLDGEHASALVRTVRGPETENQQAGG